MTRNKRYTRRKHLRKRRSTKRRRERRSRRQYGGIGMTTSVDTNPNENREDQMLARGLFYPN